MNIYPLSAEQRVFWRAAQRTGACQGHVVSARLGRAVQRTDVLRRLTARIEGCETFLLRPQAVDGYDVPFQRLCEGSAVDVRERSYPDPARMHEELGEPGAWSFDWGLNAVVAICGEDVWLWLAASSAFLDLRSMLGVLSDALSGSGADDGDGPQYLDYVEWQDERRTELLSGHARPNSRSPQAAGAPLQLPFGQGAASSGHVSIRIPRSALASPGTPGWAAREVVRQHWSDYARSMMRTRSGLYELARTPAASELVGLPGVLDAFLCNDEDEEGSEASLLIDEHRHAAGMEHGIGFGWHRSPGADATIHATSGAYCGLLLTGSESAGDDIQLLLSWQNLEWSRQDAQNLLHHFGLRLTGTYVVHDDSPFDPVRLHLIEEIGRQARDRGNEIALRDPLHTWTYSELWRRSGVLAAALVRRLGADAVAAIWAETNAEAVLAMLACLRAGRTYVPIDPQTPPERLAWLFQDTGADLLLMPSRCEGPAAGGIETWTIADAPPYVREPATGDATDTEAAYLIYTSGSSGRPKGVTISRANLDHYLQWAVQRYFDQRPRDSAVFSSLAFDMVVTPIFGCLATGGCLRLLPNDQLEDSLRHALAPENQVGLVKLTPSHIDLIAAMGIETTCVRTFVVGGEALHPHQVGILERLNGGARIYNEYGPTETTVGCLAKQVSTRDRRITIGSPIARTRVVVVDENLVPAPPGDVGELLIAGAGLGIGYWRNTELTDRSFVSVRGSSERWYRTGDLVCGLPNGEFDFLGRRDDQVKLRGHRVELGEVERVLLLHPKVRNAAAFLQSDPLPHLLACVESHEPASLAPELEAFSARYLPAYMCPDRISIRSVFPLNGNGKLDRVRLLADCGEVPAGGCFESDAQTTMADLWARALAISVDTLSPDSHYQRLGGDSIRAIRLIAAVAKQLGVRLSVKQLYENPTIRELTELCLGDALSVGSLASAAEQSAGHATAAGEPDVSFRAPENSLGMVWLSEKLVGVHAYHIQNVYHVAIERFDVDRLAAGLRQLIRRHEALRCSFDLSAGEGPLQRIAGTVEPDIRLHDLRALARKQQEAAVAGELEYDREQPFDVSVPGLWRMHAFLVDDDYQVLAWVHHHAILDGWSNAVLMRELVQCYQEPAQVLPHNPARLRDYASEQESVRRDAALKEYWRGQLQDAHSFELMGGRGQLRPGPVRWERTQALSTDVAEAIKRLADDLGLSVRDVCIGAFQHAVTTLAYRRRSFVGLVENNRPLVEGGDTLVGCFLNTVPLLCVATDEGWREKLSQTAAQLRDIKHYGRLPLSDIATLGDLGLNQASAFQILYSYVNFHVYEGQALPQRHASEAIEVRSFENTSIPLAFTTSSTLGTFEISMHSWLDEAARQSADVLFDAYEACLHNLATDGFEALPPQVHDSALMASQRANMTQFAHQDVALWQLLQHRISTGGERIAIRFGKDAISYRQLAITTAQLAAALRSHGVGKGDRVVLVLDRCLHLPSLIYAILALGACYVPIDPETPGARLSDIVHRVEPRLLVTDREIATGSDTVPIQRLTSLVARAAAPVSVLDFPGGGECAYIIFTSGTTGTPKGVVVGDAAIVNRLLWMQRAYPLATGDVVLQKTPYSFDVSVWEIFWPIIAGCELVVAEPASHQSPRTLSATMREHGVSIVHFVPSMLSAFLPELRQQPHPSLRHVFASGEALPAWLATEFLQVAPDCRLENLYGPTEAAVDVTCWSCLPDGRDVPIGRPIDNVQIHVLSESLQLLPDGCAGELCIAGAGLADGYWRDDAATRHSFVDHASLGTRIYRTGDLGCWDRRGHLAYLGRIDEQVKLRGQRIELKEIELNLTECLGGSRCIVLVAHSDTDRAHLAAFVESQCAIDQEALTNSLALRLPPYMIPRSVHTVPALPVTPNGKLDRSALLASISDASEPREEIPMSEQERILLEYWQQLLEQPIASVECDLYAKGAHSLLMIRALAKIREAFGIQLELVQLLNCASIREQARLIARETRADALLGRVNRHSVGDQDVEFVL